MSSQVWALLGVVVYLVGLVSAFGWRTWRQWRTTGSSGFRGVSGEAGSLAWWGGALFVIALLLGFVAPVLVSTGAMRPIGFLAGPSVRLGGLLLAVIGLVVTLAAQASMGASWRIGVDESEHTGLVRAGLFAFVRNPVFTGMVAVVVGVGLMAPTVVGAAAVLALVVAVQIQVRVTEEPYLIAQHGAVYVAYRARTGRFLPRIRRSGDVS